jgi:hypothetical protein
MNDRELLEMAARAAGIELVGGSKTPMVRDAGDLDYMREWRPLTDDGDALRLAVKLGMTIRNFGHLVSVMAPHQYQVDVYTNGDTCAATRRAIVRAAAEIGRTMTGESI